MDHNFEWGKLYFLTASSKGLAVIILMKLHHFFSLFLCPFYVFVQKGSSQCTFLVNFSFTVYIFGEFFFSVRFGEFSVCLVTLSNFSLTAKIRCNINSTIRIVCYISKGNFRTYVCETIPYHSIHTIIFKFRVYGRVEQILVGAVGRSENPSVPVFFDGHNLPPLVEKGLIDLPKSGCVA